MFDQCHEDTWKPIACAIRVTTQSEQNYAHIEKKNDFACERFHEFTYGRSVTVRSDHKPLKAIFYKLLNKRPSTLTEATTHKSSTLLEQIFQVETPTVGPTSQKDKIQK